MKDRAYLASVTVTRLSELDTKIRTIEVLVDGEFKCDLRYGKSFTFQVEPGEHVLRVTNKFKAAEVAFTASPGETISFSASAVFLKGCWAFLWILGVAMDEVRLERTGG